MATKRAIPMPNLANFTPAQREYLEWVRKTHPAVFSAALRKAGVAPSGLGDFDWGGMFSSIASGIKEVAPSLIQARQQIKLLDIQTKRAKAGQPPISAEEYARYATPAVEYSAELPYGSAPTAVIPRVGGMTTEKLMIYGGVALAIGAVLYFVMRKR